MAVVRLIIVLTVTMIIGLMAMLIFIGGAWWHLALLLILSAIVAWTWRGDLRRFLPG